MGTKFTMEHKINFVMQMFKAAHDAKVDIDKEKLISNVMIECLCERRKALEVIHAVAVRFNYKDKKTIYEYA